MQNEVIYLKPSIIPLPQKIRYINGCSLVNESTPVTVGRDSSLPCEGYTLSIDNNRVHITCSHEKGEFYARCTLRQITATVNGECDNLIIEDSPRFSYRGFHLDCARHFFTVNEIKILIEVAALFKINKFHWHLTDDQGWRIPIEEYPLLIEKGSVRKNSIFGGVNEGKEYSGFYTHEEIREIVDFCKGYFIEVIPEIEMPGHTSSVLASYPGLGCTGEEVQVVMKEGIFDTVLCLGNPETEKFVHTVLDTVCRLFPGEYIHIGGDETPRKKWSACPECRKKMKELGTDSYDVFQGEFIKSVGNYLKTKGKKAITWNESLKGGVLSSDDAAVQRWMEKGHLTKDFAESGGKYIESDFYHYYFDYPYGLTPVKKTYNYSPLPKGLKNSGSLLGVEGELWTEYIRDFNGICQKLYPRFFALAESGWSDEKSKNYKSFVSRVEALKPSLENMGIKIIPTAQWNMNPVSRLADIFRFFKGSLSITALKNSINNSKKS